MVFSQTVLHPYTTRFVRAVKEAGSHDLFPYEIYAIDSLVRDLIYLGLWNRMVCFYPFVGRAPVPHSFNLINPSRYRMTWSGGVTHNNEGVKGNGSNGYGDTGFDPIGILVGQSAHYALYSRFQSSANGVIDVGNNASGGATAFLFSVAENAAGTGTFDSFNNSTARTTFTHGGHTGFFIANRNSENAAVSKNGTVLNTNSTTGGSIPSVRVFLFCYSDGNSPAAFSDRQFSSLSIGYGLTSNEFPLYHNIIQKYQTLLNRQV